MAPGPRRIGLVISVALAASLSACTMGGPVMSGQSRAVVEQRPRNEAVGGVYTVVAGDTIYVVARKFDITVRALIDANGLQPPFQLEPGQILRLPMGGSYVVVKGDTLAKVARKAGVEFATLARMNNLSPPYRIRVGQRLILPTGSTVAGAPGSAGGEVVTQSGNTTVIQSPNAGQPGVSAAPVAPLTVEALPAPQVPPREATTFGTATRPGLVPGATTVPGQPPSASAPPAPASTQPVAASAQPARPAASSGAQGGAVETITSAQAVPPKPIAPPAPASAPASAAPAPFKAPDLQTAAATPAPPAPRPPPDMPAFIWPVHGPVLSPFGTIAKGQHNDGVNIAVPKGTPVLAAGDGEVAYAGNELRGFGNLLLIKHTGTDYVTAYAHNAKLLVKKGQHVHRGQEIAISGNSGGVSQPQLHFELRQGVKAIDPQAALPPELSPAPSPTARQDPG